MSAGDLWIEDTTNPNLGFSYGSLNSAPTFIRLPCSESLTIMKESQDRCNAIRCCIKAQSKTLCRGSSRQVFSDVWGLRRVEQTEVFNRDITESRRNFLMSIGIVYTIHSRKGNRLFTIMHQRM